MWCLLLVGSTATELSDPIDRKEAERSRLAPGSRNGESTILVYPSGSASDVKPLASGWRESLHQETLPDGTKLVGFARQIQPVDGQYIVEHYRDHGGPKPPHIDHHGINDAYLEKGSTVRYWYRGQWLELQGAD